jgi:hypothetical protein
MKVRKRHPPTAQSDTLLVSNAVLTPWLHLRISPSLEEVLRFLPFFRKGKKYPAKNILIILSRL